MRAAWPRYILSVPHCPFSRRQGEITPSPFSNIQIIIDPSSRPISIPQIEWKPCDGCPQAPRVPATLGIHVTIHNLGQGNVTSGLQCKHATLRIIRGFSGELSFKFGSTTAARGLRPGDLVVVQGIDRRLDTGQRAAGQSRSLVSHVPAPAPHRRF